MQDYNQDIGWAGSFWRPQGRICLSSPPVPGAWLHSMVQGSSSCHLNILFPSSHCLLLSLTTCHPHNPGSSSHFKGLSLITSAGSLFPCNVTYSQVAGIRTFFGERYIIQPLTLTNKIFHYCLRCFLKVSGRFLKPSFFFFFF